MLCLRTFHFNTHPQCNRVYLDPISLDSVFLLLTFIGRNVHCIAYVATIFWKEICVKLYFQRHSIFQSFVIFKKFRNYLSVVLSFRINSKSKFSVQVSDLFQANDSWQNNIFDQCCPTHIKIRFLCILVEYLILNSTDILWILHIFLTLAARPSCCHITLSCGLRRQEELMVSCFQRKYMCI